MRIATFNINGINGRLSNLMAWLTEKKPDVACLQELKASDAAFPIAAIRDAGYDAIWHGQPTWNGVAILARNTSIIETRRGLPGEPGDAQSRYLEAAIDGVLVGCLYVPNGNPWPGPRFEYKLRWFERFAAHAGSLLATGAPVALVGDYNVMPTDLDVYAPERWLDNALFRPEVREGQDCHMQDGDHGVMTGWGFLAVRLPLPQDKQWAADQATILQGLGGWSEMQRDLTEIKEKAVELRAKHGSKQKASS